MNTTSINASARSSHLQKTIPTTIEALSSHKRLIILASGSPRRRELLELVGLPFIIVLPESSPLAGGVTGQAENPVSQAGVDETPLRGELPPDLVRRLSRAKASAVAARLSSLNLPEFGPAATATRKRTAIIIAADTVVVSNNKILGKPDNRTAATQMLRSLRQQRCHHVYSGLTVGLWTEHAPSQGTKRTGEQPTVGNNDLSTHSYHLRLITRLHQSKVWMRRYTDAEIEAYVASGDPLDKAGAYAIQHKGFAPVEKLEGCFAGVMGLPLGELVAALNDIGLSLPDITHPCTQYSGYPCCQQTADASQ